MRLILPLAALLFPAVAFAQSSPPPGTDVERVTLHPGESVSFTLAPGKEHQLLRETAPTTPRAITIGYQTAGSESTITAVSHTGTPLVFTVLADPGGNGGFVPAGDIDLPGDGTPVARTWPRSLGTINVGDFVGGPHGDRPHVPSGG